MLFSPPLLISWNFCLKNYAGVLYLHLTWTKCDTEAFSSLTHLLPSILSSPFPKPSSRGNNSPHLSWACDQLFPMFQTTPDRKCPNPLMLETHPAFSHMLEVYAALLFRKMKMKECLAFGSFLFWFDGPPQCWRLFLPPMNIWRTCCLCCSVCLAILVYQLPVR